MSGAVSGKMRPAVPLESEVYVINSRVQLLFLPVPERRSSQHAAPRTKFPVLCTKKKTSAVLIIAASIILCFGPAAPAHFDSGISTVITGTQEFPKLEQSFLLCSWHPYLRLKPRESVTYQQMSCWGDAGPLWEDCRLLRKNSNTLSAALHLEKKKTCVGSSSLPTFPASDSVSFGSKAWNSRHSSGRFCTSSPAL